MPRGRIAGNINRKPGIFGQTIEKVRDESGNIDRNRINIQIDYNDKDGNRFTRTFEARMNKDFTGVYIPTTSETALVSEYVETEKPENAPTPLAIWNDSLKETIRKIRAEMGLGTKGRVPAEKREDFDSRLNSWMNENPRPEAQ